MEDNGRSTARALPDELPNAEEAMALKDKSQFSFMHRRFRDEMVRFALGEFAGRSHGALLQHTTECPMCRHDLSEVYRDISILYVGAIGPVPPARLRDRLLAKLR